MINWLTELWEGIKVGLMILSFVAAGFAAIFVSGGIIKLAGVIF